MGKLLWMVMIDRNSKKRQKRTNKKMSPQKLQIKINSFGMVIIKILYVKMTCIDRRNETNEGTVKINQSLIEIDGFHIF